MFYACGIKGEVIGKTPSRCPILSWSGHRGTEIYMWLNNIFNCRNLTYTRNTKEEIFKVDNFVILDDDSDMEPFMNKHIKTKFDCGLQEKHSNKAIKILKGY